MTTTEDFPQIHCVKCREKTDNVDPKRVRMKNGRGAVEALCAVCNTRKFRIGGPAPEVES